MDNYDYLWSIYRLAIKHGNRKSTASSMIFQLDHKQRGYQWIELIHVESYNTHAPTHTQKTLYK